MIMAASSIEKWWLSNFQLNALAFGFSGTANQLAAAFKQLSNQIQTHIHSMHIRTPTIVDCSHCASTKARKKRR